MFFKLSIRTAKLILNIKPVFHTLFPVLMHYILSLPLDFAFIITQYSQSQYMYYHLLIIQPSKEMQSIKKQSIGLNLSYNFLLFIEL